MPTPKLRFKDENGQDFPEYSRNFITKLCSIKNGNINAEDGSDKGCYRFFDRGIESVKFADSYFLDKEAIIYAGEGSSFLPKYYFGKFALHQRCYALYDFHNSIAVEYVYQYLLTKNSHFIRYAVGSTVKSLRLGSFNTCEVIIPCLDEQHKIAEFLSTVDEKVEVLEKKLEALNSLKKGFMQKIFSQELRFKDDSGQDFPEWECKELNNIAKSVNLKNTAGDILEPLTVSAEQGIVLQQDYFDRAITNEKNINGYTIVEKYDFIYNPRISSLAKAGPIKLSKVKTGVVSPLYTVFRVKSSHKDSIEFLEHYFNSDAWVPYMQSVANYGARSDRMSLKKQDFYALPVIFPCLEEQRKIAEFLSAFDEKIEAVKRQVEAMKQVKKGLLQQMFV
ncbi:restriction endonuclease subunit S [Anaerobiospirillum sp. NML120448]|uniref:restriction endonuclease subunit S n=1 Tax=Anaerobiospirillum sp. NML120448 TaxID=2932816 RepID=UPI001FF4E5E0|nr:restriction endonuclease subunit S [Anaerobiospirillum sp. NML120448]MCK0514373.1 restriction endonuclease subunit S [Anaerobiospirillum sp. NML120448]